MMIPARAAWSFLTGIEAGVSAAVHVIVAKEGRAERGDVCGYLLLGPNRFHLAGFERLGPPYT